MAHTPLQENLTTDNAQKSVYSYCNEAGVPVFLARELNKKLAKIIVHLYYPNRRTGLIRQPKITTVEFNGWSGFDDLPGAFKKKIQGETYFGIYSKTLKDFLSTISRKLPKLEKVVFGLSATTRFYEKTVTLNWSTVDRILTEIEKENAYYKKNRRFLMNNELSALSSKFKRQTKEIHANELRAFLEKFDGFDRMTEEDTEALSKVLEILPKTKISVTANFIKTKDKINIAYVAFPENRPFVSVAFPENRPFVSRNIY